MSTIAEKPNKTRIELREAAKSAPTIDALINIVPDNFVLYTSAPVTAPDNEGSADKPGLYELLTAAGMSYDKEVGAKIENGKKVSPGTHLMRNSYTDRVRLSNGNTLQMKVNQVASYRAMNKEMPEAAVGEDITDALLAQGMVSRMHLTGPIRSPLLYDIVSKLVNSGYNVIIKPSVSGQGNIFKSVPRDTNHYLIQFLQNGQTTNTRLLDVVRE